MGIIVHYCSPSYYIVKLSQFLREVRFLRGTYEKIVSSAADRPKLVVKGHAPTENAGLTLGSRVLFLTLYAGNFN